MRGPIAYFPGLRLVLAFACFSLNAAVADTMQPLALPAPPRAFVEERIGAQVPLDLPALDDEGRTLRMADVVDGTRPVLLVPGYYRCAQLCGLVMHSLLDGLHASGVPRERWRIVGVGIDPRETADDARARRSADIAYATSLEGPASRREPIDLHLLTLDAAQLRRVTSAIGFRFSSESAGENGQIAHPATVVLLTPQGKVSRYFNGIGIEGGELRVALADAAQDRLGAASARLALLCAHFAPRVGRYGGLVLDVARGVSMLVLLALGIWCWRTRFAHKGSAS